MQQINKILTISYTGFTKDDLNSLLKILSVAVLKLRKTKVKEIKGESLTIADYTAAVKVGKAIGIKQDTIRAIWNNLLKTELRQVASDAVGELRQAVNKANLSGDEKSTLEHREIMSAVLTLFKTPDSMSAYTKLQKSISGLKSPAITKAVIEATKSEVSKDKNIGSAIDSIVSDLKKIVKKLTKKDSTALSAAEMKTLKEKGKADEVKQYSDLQKKFKLAQNVAIRAAVADSGKKFITLKALADWQKKNGINVATWNPTLYKSKFICVNIDGELVDHRGVKITGAGDIRNPKSNIILNTNYKPDPKVKGNNWIFKVKTDAATNQYGPEDVKSATRQDKFTRVSFNADQIEAIKKRWRSKMKPSPKNMEDPNVVYPFFAEFLFQTASRVGSTAKGQSGGADTHGASNFLVSHIVKGKTGTGPVLLKYPVKSGKLQEFVINPAMVEGDDAKSMKMLANFIKKKAEGKKPGDIVFTLNGKHMNTAYFTKWLQATTKTKLKPHDFRSLRGTQIASEALQKATDKVNKIKKSKGKITQTEANKLFLAAITEVGKKLGHVRRGGDGDEKVTPATAIKSYVAPKLMVDYFRNAGVPPMKPVVQAARKSGIEA